MSQDRHFLLKRYDSIGLPNGHRVAFCTEVAVDYDQLAPLIIKAYRNKRRKSQDGPVEVKVTRVTGKGSLA